jgi:hypothetical protein
MIADEPLERAQVDSDDRIGGVSDVASLFDRSVMS